MSLTIDNSNPRQTLAQIFKQTPYPPPLNAGEWTLTQQVNYAIMNAKAAIRFGQLVRDYKEEVRIDLSFTAIGNTPLTADDISCLNASVKALAKIAGCDPSKFTASKPLAKTFFEHTMGFIFPQRHIVVTDITEAEKLVDFARRAKLQGGIDRPEIEFSYTVR